MSLLKLADLMQVSSLEKGVLTIPGVETQDMQRLGSILREGLLDMNIPHYRVIGIRVMNTVQAGSGAVSTRNVTTKITWTNNSYLELFQTVSELAYAESGGFLNQKHFEDKERINSKLGYQLGVLRGTGDVNSANGSICWMSESEVIKPRCLLQNKSIGKMRQAAWLAMIAVRGTGVWDFIEAERKLRDITSLVKIDNYFVPVRAIYDLNSIMAMRPYFEEDENKLYFYYKEKCDEEVLHQILKDYITEVDGK